MFKSLPPFARVLTVLLVTAILLLPAQGAQAVIHKVGLVTDVNGLGDNSFNDMANTGLQQAVTDLGVTGTVYQPATEGDYGTALQQCVTDGNEICFAVGFSLGDATLNAANANPGTKFATLDYSYDPSAPANLRGILFDEKQVGYLAGVLAAEMSDTQVVGAVGGMEIPPVVRFMEGYRNGAQCTDNNVDVLLNYTGTFVDPVLGAAVAADMMTNSNADIIYGVGGMTGNGAIEYAAQNGAWSIGVDTDQWVTVFGSGSVAGSDKILSSAMKRIDNAVYMTIQDVLGGNFTAGDVTYDLSNDGVGLAPYHEADGEISNSVKAHVNNAKNSIVSGGTDVNYPCRGPALIEPANNVLAHTRRPFFDWEDISGITYTLQVSLTSGFDKLKLNITLTDSFYMPKKDLAANTLYYWRVMITPPIGPSAYSETYKFTTGNPPKAPGLSLPKKNALVFVPRPTFDWKDVKLPSGTAFNYYQIQVAITNAFDALDIVIDDTTTPLDITKSYYTSTTVDLNPATTYYWRVRAFNTADDYSNWSKVSTFRTAYAAPNLTDPIGGVLSMPATFNWDAMPGVTSYKIQISTDAAFKTKVVYVTVYANSYTLTKTLTMGITYYWRVQALGKYGPGAWGTQSFYTP